MPNHFSIKRGGFSSHFSNLWLLIAAFLLAFPVASLAEETAKAPVKAKEIPAAAASAPCQGLKPFKEIDELMHQIYSNLESDCLFKMDPKELAEIWGIPSMEYNSIHKSPFYSKERRPHVEGDHAHLLLRADDTDEDPYIDFIVITFIDGKDTEKHPFFPDYNYPKLLPPPLIYKIGPSASPTGEIDCRKGQYIDDTMYNWFNSDRTRVLILQTGCGTPHTIRVEDVVRPGFFEGSHYE